MRSKKLCALALFLAAMLLSFPVFGEEDADAPVAAPESSFDGVTVVATDRLYDSFADAEEICDGLCLGWFATERTAKALDTVNALSAPRTVMYGAFYVGDVLELLGAQMRTSAPAGVRFVSSIDTAFVRAVEAVSAKNRIGKGGSFVPANEYRSDYGFGTALALSVTLDGELEKPQGDNVMDGMCVPGVYLLEETDEKMVFTATVIGIDTASDADEITARPYVTYTDANGGEHTYFYTEPDSASGGYGVSLYALCGAVTADDGADDEAKTAAQAILEAYAASPVTLTPITALNATSEDGSADDDNAYIEADHTTRAVRTIADHDRYQLVCYPRMVKVRDDLYLLTFHRGQLGNHLYYTTSTDGVNWGDPAVLYNSGAAVNRFTYTEGALDGTDDLYLAVNADLCLTSDGQLLCVYSRRPSKGYTLYNSYSSIELIRGTVSGDTISWSKPTTIYRGANWEPEIIERADGRIEVFWSQAAPYIDLYGFTRQKRSSGVGMIYSTDGGYTFTPGLEEMAANHYAGIRVLEDYVGDMNLLPLDDTRSESELAKNETQIALGSQPADYTPGTVHFYSGQMPGVVELVGGRMMVVAESEPIAKNGMNLVAAFSDADGEWTPLGIDEEGPSTLMDELFKAAAPTLCRFPSGEVLLSYNLSGKACTRLLHKDGQNIASATETRPLADTNYSGFWSGTSILDAHTAMVAMTYNDPADTVNTTKNRMLLTAMVRLNHTLNAARKNVIADGIPQEWTDVTDALFVGSASETQATYRFAYDDTTLYVLIERTDEGIGENDSTFCSIFAGTESISLSFKGEECLHLPLGAVANTRAAEGGRVFEFALDRAALGLEGDSIRVCPGLSEDGVLDMIDGISAGDTSSWIKVNLK